MIVNIYLFGTPANLTITIDGIKASQCFRPGRNYLAHVDIGFGNSFDPSYWQSIPDEYQLLLTTDCPDNVAIRSLLLSLPPKFPELFL